MHSPPSYTAHSRAPPFIAPQPGEVLADEKVGSLYELQTPSALSPGSTDQRQRNGLQPFLGLRARIFLAMLSPAILSLLFIIARLLANSADIDSRVAVAKATLMSDCQRAEDALTWMQSWPHFAAARANERTQKVVEGTVEATGKVLMLAITAVDAVLVYIVDTYRSLFLCVIELLVRGSLALVMEAVDLFNEAVQVGANAIKAAVQASITAINDTVKGVLSIANDLLKLVGQSIDIPQITTPDLSALDNVTLPSSFLTGLQDLNSSLPTLDDLRQKVDALITQPFDQLRTDVNGTINNFTFDTSLLPVPTAAPLASFCNGLGNTPLDDFARDLRKFTWLGIGIIAAIALLLASAIAVKEVWVWRCMRTHVQRTREAFRAAEKPSNGSRSAYLSAITQVPVPAESWLHNDDSLFSLLQLSHHPLIASIVLCGGRHVGLRSKRKLDATRWYLAWLTHPAALTALAVGVVGLLTTQLQILALQAVEGHYRDKVGATFDDAMDGMFNGLNASMRAASAQFANETNTVILQRQSDLNDVLFSWVNITTSTMNNTLNEFTDAVADIINSTFANTPLLAPVQTFVNCILLRKVAGIEQALTWIQDNAHATFPLVDDGALLLDASQQKEIMAQAKGRAIGDSSEGGSGSGGVLGEIAGGYEKSLQKERIMFLFFVGIYVVVALVGLHAMLLASHRRTRNSMGRSAGTTAITVAAGPGVKAPSVRPRFKMRKAGIDTLRGQSIAALNLHHVPCDSGGGSVSGSDASAAGVGTHGDSKAGNANAGWVRANTAAVQQQEPHFDHGYDYSYSSGSGYGYSATGGPAWWDPRRHYDSGATLDISGLHTRDSTLEYQQDVADACLPLDPAAETAVAPAPGTAGHHVPGLDAGLRRRSTFVAVSLGARATEVYHHIGQYEGDDGDATAAAIAAAGGEDAVDGDGRYPRWMRSRICLGHARPACDGAFRMYDGPPGHARGRDVGGEV
ncbi:hypothetical protein K437DRAFT_243012 [Tilletiaria anomala UBC 951]|uniref:Plasma membrane fusion protein PRM1 n=1 Tax=Tilletiaria anomala (strain ATCC 24038 / CBS 436.72 / UBC 951) TaxID=1037660 RepID=A0A066WFZ4_TILAU|nr:uncharacterized protein K437DRAFT_243012 [Tilletiaria anomala UBC 951]KDN52862.1 hypothetical protein K437DRAFT_243012 [Tilletiaria anomala UBC 951]